MTRTLRVLVVDDDPAFRRVLGQTCSGIPGVGEVTLVGNLQLAKARLTSEPYDVVTLDVVLRDECGLDLLPWVREHRPATHVLLVTSGARADAATAVDALFHGASGLVLKPSGPDAAASLTRALSRHFELMAGEREQLGPAAESLLVRPPPQARGNVLAAARELVAIGASTGGPPVVQAILRDLPASFSVPIVVTQHMPAFHLPMYAEMLERGSRRRVVLAHDGERLEPGVTYVAPGEAHLEIVRRGGELHVSLSGAPPEHHCKPAVDPMLRSVASVVGAAAVGVVVTGMGSDGALGSVAMRARGAPVVVQDRDTSVVWGMPGATVAAGGADAVVPASAIAATILDWTLPRHARKEAFAS